MKYEFEQEYKQIGLKIAYYRKLKGLTQEQLAEKMGTTTAYTTRYAKEKGVRVIKLV